jgi:hypothetical protein
VVAEVDPVIGRDALGEQIRIQRVGTGEVLTHGQRFVGFVAVAYLHRRCALSGMSHAGIVAGTAHRDRRILREFAIEAIGSVDGGGIGR